MRQPALLVLVLACVIGARSTLALHDEDDGGGSGPGGDDGPGGPGGDDGPGMGDDASGPGMGDDASGPGGDDASGGVMGSCDICGADASYVEVIDGTTRTITASGCPNHYNACQELEMSHCTGNTEAGFQGDGTSSGTVSYTIPAYPVISSSPVDATCIVAAIGVALNGVSFFSQTDGTNACGDAYQSEAPTFDNCGGHATPDGWEYHYHGPPACLINQILEENGIDDSTHSPQLGWMLDGFPIYGGQGPGGVDMMPCESDGADATYCLDECNGYYGETDVDDFKYRYYVGGPVGDLTCSTFVENAESADGADCAGTCCMNTISGTEYWPYVVGCFKGCLEGEDCDSSEDGFTSSYEATATEGVTTQYLGAETSDGITCPTEYSYDYSSPTAMPAVSPTAPDACAACCARKRKLRASTSGARNLLFGEMTDDDMACSGCACTA